MACVVRFLNYVICYVLKMFKRSFIKNVAKPCVLNVLLRFVFLYVYFLVLNNVSNCCVQLFGCSFVYCMFEARFICLLLSFNIAVSSVFIFVFVICCFDILFVSLVFSFFKFLCCIISLMCSTCY